MSNGNPEEMESPRLDVSPAEVWLKGYRWPSSRFTTEDMARLSELRYLTGKPITVVLQNAVRYYWDLVTLMHRECANSKAQDPERHTGTAGGLHASTDKTFTE